MSVAQGLRWSGKGVCSGRQRLFAAARDVRYYSISTARTTASLTRRTPIPASATRRLNLSQQNRSLSFWATGWGSSKASSAATAAEGVTPETPASSVAVTDGSIPQAAIDSVRTVKASHATSEAPDPLISQSVAPVEPEPIKALEDAILKPHGAANPAADTPDLASIAEGPGYLKDVCGLDFGWGPTAFFESLLEYTHLYSGLSWTASIIVLTVGCRLLMLPSNIKAADVTAGLREMQPVLQPLREKMQKAAADNDRATSMQLQREIQQISRDSGISLMAAFTPLVLQLPFIFCWFRLLRNASQVPVPAFESENFLWLSNIAVADPTWALPIVIAASTYLNVVTGAAQQPNNPLLNAFKWIFPPLTFLWQLWQPASVQIFFLTSTIFTQIQQSSLRNARVREWLKIRPIPAPMAPKPAPMNKAQRTPQQAASSEEVNPSANRSWIDKAVDTSKATWKSAYNDTIGSAKKAMDTSGAMAKRKAEQKNVSAAKYEAERRQLLDEQRERRNQSLAASARQAAGAARVPGGSGKAH